MRSGFERTLATQLKRDKVAFEYEPVKLPYTIPHVYIPDFRLKNGVIIEAKGKLDPITRAKMVAVKKAHPHLDIRFVFMRGSNRLSKNSRTTYMDWAAKNGFPAADGKIPLGVDKITMMTQAQVKYARQRAEAIYKEKIITIQQNNRVDAVTLTHEEKIDALKNGRFTVVDNVLYGGWPQAIKFNEERPAVYNDKKTKEELTELKVEFNKLMDELMLGDNEEALALLKAFEAL